MTGLGLQCFLLVLSTTFAAGKAYSYATVLSAEAHKYVDLGLSVKWATSNIGASKPEELGDYYAWGEKETKSTYSEETYKYYKLEIVWIDYDVSVEEKGYIKYIPSSQSFYGFKRYNDDEFVLDDIDDVAACKSGYKWRMPTVEELKELIENCLRASTGLRRFLRNSHTPLSVSLLIQKARARPMM